MKTASALGYYNVDEMLAEAPAGQLYEWAAYWELEPFGNPWEAMSIAATSIVNEIRSIAAAFRSDQTQTQYMDADDFVPGRIERKLSAEDAATAAAIDDLEQW